MNGLLRKAPIAAWGVAVLLAAAAAGQSASLLRSPPPPPPGVALAPPVTLDDVSLVKLAPPPAFRLHDLVHIQVNESIVNRINARINSRRNIQYDYSLEDWILLLNDGSLNADNRVRAQTPGVDFSALTQNQKQYQFNRDDVLRYSLQAEVVEIRPNGNLVLEANGEVSVNNDVYQFRMSGVVDPRDVDPVSRTVDSTRVASRRLDLRELGQARDALKRGWFATFLDWFNPF
jgi:flagellar L-ring protein precursor FlgH